MKNLRGADFFRKIGGDLAQKTLVGGVTSIVAITIMTLLFFSELGNYASPELEKKVMVDSDHSANELLQVSLNVTMTRMPCELLSLDQQDEVGHHRMDITGSLAKVPLDKDGKRIGRTVNMRPAADELTKAIDAGEQCRMEGYFFVNKVPGNFHISFHARRDSIAAIEKNAPTYIQKLNLSHELHHLFFGTKVDFTKGEFGEDLSKQYEGMIFEDTSKTNYSYYIKIVPSRFKDKNGELTQSYQYSMNHHHTHFHGKVPAIYFQYDMSPYLAEYSFVDKRFTNFLVQACAILGGVFVVLGLLNTFVLNSVAAIKKNS